MVGEPREPNVGEPAGDAGNQPGGTPPSGSTGAPVGTGEKPAVIPISVLPKELQNLPENQIGYLLTKMVEGVRNSSQEIKTLKQEIENLKKGGEKSEKPKEPEKPLREQILDDPEGALDRILAERFGPAIQRLESVEKRVGESEFLAVRQEFSDFAEVEDEVRMMLKEGNLPATRENIAGAYTLLVGQKVLEERKRAARTNAGSEPARTEPPVAPKNYQKTQLSEEFRQRAGLSEEEFYETFSARAPLAVKLPGVKDE